MFPPFPKICDTDLHQPIVSVLSKFCQPHDEGSLYREPFCSAGKLLFRCILFDGMLLVGTGVFFY